MPSGSAPVTPGRSVVNAHVVEGLAALADRGERDRAPFDSFPPSGRGPRGHDLEQMALRLDRTRHAVSWQFLDAHRYCAGLSTTAAPVLMKYLDRVGLSSNGSSASGRPAVVWLANRDRPDGRGAGGDRVGMEGQRRDTAGGNRCNGVGPIRKVSP